MRLNKLELNGFKSFANKTEIVFGSGITAVIGPNGSGKSNISDSIRWVLGEQNARNLRGTKMEDVIFNGTQKRKSQSFCEVTLEFDNADGKLKLPYDEVAVTRRVYRSGDSEYCINRNACRLKDIQELFRDTGIGKDGYSIISQGKVEEILSNRSNERRAALEEAAGVMNYRVRKEEAERKLENTRKNLERLNDIVQELADRIGPLEEQSAAARTYLNLRDELKDLEINLFLHQYDRDTEKLAQIASSLEQMHSELDLSERMEQEILASCNALEDQISAADAVLTEQQNRLLEMLSSVETKVGESKVLHERIEHGKSERTRIEGELNDCAEQIRRLNGMLLDLQDPEEALLGLRQADEEVSRQEQALSDADRRAEEAELHVEELKNIIIDNMNRMADYRSNLSRYEAMESSIDQRLDAIGQENILHLKKREALQAEFDAADRILRERQDAVGQKMRQYNEAVEEKRSAQAGILSLQDGISAKERELSSAEARLRTLREMARSREGYYASVRSVMQDAERDSRLKEALIGVFAELVSVPKKYEQAVTMALGSASQNLITRTAEDARYVIEYLRRRDYGRATLLPMDILRVTALSEQERRLLGEKGCIGIASSLVSFDPSIRTAVEYLLGRTLIVEDLQSGIAIKNRTRTGLSIATLDGDIISGGGAMSGGSRQKNAMFSLFSREREIKELSERERTLEKEILSARNELGTSDEKLARCDRKIENLREEVHALELERAREQEQTSIIQRDLDQETEHIEQLKAESEQLMDALEDLKREIREATEGQQTAQQGAETTKEDVRKAQEEVVLLRQAREEAAAALTDLKVRQMALRKEQDARTAERARIQKEENIQNARREQLLALQEENERSCREAEEQFERMRGTIQTEQSDADQQKADQQKAEENRRKLSESLAEQRARREQLLISARDLTDRIHKQDLARGRVDMELQSIQDHIWNEYELTYENAKPYRKPAGTNLQTGRINEIRTAIRELGPINVNAIEEYQTVSERYSDLTAQCGDLTQAQEDLGKLIGELTERMKKIFSEQFSVIQKNFTSVFTELFGGGVAELRLGDDKDVLNCDIDIIAQPPGKKLQLLSLLSGGERALTAIALLFALLKLKPPAFCVLDEIDTSLDEANVSRFAEYVRHYSDSTQFILITHRKGSMEVCNTMYGVSMEERGISKVVSARFEEEAV